MGISVHSQVGHEHLRHAGVGDGDGEDEEHRADVDVDRLEERAELLRRARQQERQQADQPLDTTTHAPVAYSSPRRQQYTSDMELGHTL